MSYVVIIPQYVTNLTQLRPEELRWSYGHLAQYYKFVSWVKDDSWLCVHASGRVRFFMSVRRIFSCSFSRSRGQGWEGRSASTAEATGNCSTSYKQRNTPCSRACDHLPLAVDLLPKPGLGECLPWPGHPGQEPSYRRPGKPESRRDGWGRLIIGSMLCGQGFEVLHPYYGMG